MHLRSSLLHKGSFEESAKIIEIQLFKLLLFYIDLTVDAKNHILSLFQLILARHFAKVGKTTTFISFIIRTNRN